MQLNQISLSASLLETLYSKSLVITGNPKVKVVPPVSTNTSEADPVEKNTDPVAEQPLQFLGNNSRKFVILVNYPDDLHITDNAYEFLTNLLKACELNAADVAIVNTASQLLNLEQIHLSLQPKILLLFGNLPLANPLPEADMLQAFTLNGTRLLYAPPIEYLNQKTVEVQPIKRKLWQELLQLIKS